MVREAESFPHKLFFDTMPVPLDLDMCPLACALYIQQPPTNSQYVSIITYAEFVDDAIAESVSFQSNGDVTKKTCILLKLKLCLTFKRKLDLKVMS